MAADIHALEIEFAKNPTLEACLPLCEAYLKAKRYMEAMVVCKKGIKNASPSDPRGRVMLARVYLEQGKLPKAEQEMTQVMAEFPGAPVALELMGRILMEQGKRPEAIERLQQAVQGDPSLEKARAWLAEMGGGAPAAPAAAAPRAPAAAAKPGAPARPGAAAPAAPAAAPAAAPVADAGHGHGHAAAPAPARPLEHVGDFFAAETLGFTSESGIETAGPGRLTILGFVPKSTGSLKTTILVFLGFLAAGSAFITWQFISSKNQRVISGLFKEIRTALDEDRYGRYKEAVKLGEKILAVDSGHILTLSALTYAEAVLAVDHREPGALEQAQKYLERALKAPAKEENEFRVGGRALIAYSTHAYDKGLADIKAVMDKGGSSAIIELEAYRLMDAVKPDDKDTKLQMARLVRSVSSQARGLNYMAWNAYRQEEWSKAGKFFDQTLQNVRGHPVALLGRSLVALDQGIGLEQKQKDIEKDLKEVFAIPPDDMSAPISALAFFTRSQLLRWQDNVAKADEDFQQAIKLDPDNMLFYYRRGVALLKMGDAKGAVEAFRKVAGAEPNNPKYLKKLASAQIKAAALADAKATLSKVAQLTPNDYEVHILQGGLALGQKDFDTALKEYRAVTREDGAEPFISAQLAISEAMRSRGEKPQAVKFMEDSLTKMPEGASAEMQSRMWCELGQNYEATKNKNKALESFRVGIEQYRYYPDCHFFACRALGKGPEAKEACRAYLALDPRGRYAAEAQKHAK